MTIETTTNTHTDTTELAALELRMSSLSDLDKGFLAGLIEGSGSIDAQKGRYARLRLSSTERDNVARLADLTGSAVTLTLAPHPQRAVWNTTVTGAKAQVVMRHLLPLMSASRSSEMASLLALGLRRRVTSGIRIERPPLIAPRH